MVLSSSPIDSRNADQAARGSGRRSRASPRRPPCGARRAGDRRDRSSSHRGARGSEAGSRVPGGTRPISSCRFATAPRGSPSSRRRSGRGTSRGRAAWPAAARAPRCARCTAGTASSGDDARSSLSDSIAALGPVVGRVVVARVLVDRHQLVPQHELGGEEEVRLALHEAVERVEAAVRRPAVLRPGRHAVRCRRVVPLAGHDRLVAGRAQRLGERRAHRAGSRPSSRDSRGCCSRASRCRPRARSCRSGAQRARASRADASCSA